jgi:hypothetical protein
MMEPVGVSVNRNGDYHFLRIHLRPEHLTKIGEPDRLTIRGTAANGFILTAGNGKGALKPSKIGDKLRYLQTSITNVNDLSAHARKPAWLKLEFEKNGTMRVPPLPLAWIRVDQEFDGEPIAAEGSRPMKNGNDHPDGNGSPTAPQPKPVPVYQVPQDALVAALTVELGRKLGEAREIIKALEAKTGLRLTLDRNFRVVVAL